MEARVVPADALEGARVVDPDGEELGTLEELMIDVQAGRVAYAVMSCAGQPGEKLFAIPWTALARDAARRCFVLATDRERLQRAPAFDRDHWPEMADGTWAAQVHEYYGVAPYWSGGGVAGEARPLRA